MDPIIVSVILSGLISLVGVWYVERGKTRSATFETLVNAYKAMSEENERLRVERDRCRLKITDLEHQLARAYSARYRTSEDEA